MLGGSIVHFTVPRFKQRLSVVVPDFNNIQSVLDVTTVCDSVVFLMSASSDTDPWGDTLLSAVIGEKFNYLLSRHLIYLVCFSTRTVLRPHIPGGRHLRNSRKQTAGGKEVVGQEPGEEIGDRQGLECPDTVGGSEPPPTYREPEKTGNSVPRQTRIHPGRVLRVE